MKKRHFFAAAVTAYLISVIAITPASTVINLFSDKFPQIKIRGASGSLWNGTAKQLTIQSKATIEQLNWSLNSWRLFTGEVSFNVNASYRKQPVQAQVGIGITGRKFARHLSTELHAKNISELAALPFGEFSGTIAVNLDILSWQQGEIPRVEGQLNWKNAAVKVAESVNLGEVVIQLTDSGNFPVVATIINSGGQLSLDGNAHITDEANYELELKLTPAKGTSNNLRSSLSLFAKKQANGSFVVNNKGHLKQLGIM